MTRHTVHERTLARKSALALLYSSDITEQDVAHIVESGAYPSTEIDVPEYAEFLVKGVNEHLASIDTMLSSTSENWALDRMPIIDRAVLRMALFEMFYVDDVPVSVAINEAVELAKAFGGEDDSSRFVNGILGRIARANEHEVAAGAAEDAAETMAESAAEDVADAAAKAATEDAPAEAALEQAAENAAEASDGD